MPKNYIRSKWVCEYLTQPKKQIKQETKKKKTLVSNTTGNRNTRYIIRNINNDRKQSNPFISLLTNAINYYSGVIYRACLPYLRKWLSHLVHETQGTNANQCLIAFDWLRVRARVVRVFASYTGCDKTNFSSAARGTRQSGLPRQRVCVSNHQPHMQGDVHLTRAA